MTEHAQPRIWAGIDIPKTIAGTLAAVSAAVIGSFLGVAGTLIGAAVASLISSVGTEVYHRYLNHGTKKLQAAFVTAPAAVGTPEVAAAEEETPSGTPRKIRWKRIAMVTGALFVLAMGTLTVAELLAGRSAADATGGRDGGAPTVFNWSGNHSDDPATPAPAPSATPTGTDPAPTGAATTPAGTGTATTAPAQDPTTEAPADPTPTGDSGGDTTTGGGSDTGGDTTQQGTAEQPQ